MFLKKNKSAWIKFIGTISAALIVALIGIISDLLYQKSIQSIENEINDLEFENPMSLSFHPDYSFDYKRKKVTFKTNDILCNYYIGIGLSDKEGNIKDKILMADRRAILDLNINIETYVLNEWFIFSKKMKKTDHCKIIFLLSKYELNNNIYILRRIYYNEIVASIIVMNKNNSIIDIDYDIKYDIADMDDIFKKNNINKKDSSNNYNIIIESNASYISDNDNYNEIISIKYPFENLEYDLLIEEQLKNIRSFRNPVILQSYDENGINYKTIKVISNNYFYGHMQNKVDLFRKFIFGSEGRVDTSMGALRLIAKIKFTVKNVNLEYFKINNKTIIEKYSIKNNNIINNTATP